MQDRDYAHDQSSPGKGGTERERKRESVVERQTNTAVESTDKEDKVKYVDGDVEVDQKHDTGDEKERKYPVNSTSKFSTNRV